MESFDGDADRRRAEEHLAQRLPSALQGLGPLAYNYWWSWQPGLERLFESVDPERWTRGGENPVRLLQEVDPAQLNGLAHQADFVGEVQSAAGSLAAYLAARDVPGTSPVVYMCAEFGVHNSLPFYAGGLGVLAGDYLKQASDLATPFVGVGLFYREGSFHQRLDISGWQHEYWMRTDSDRLPAVVVSGDNGPLTVSVRIHGREVAACIWRIDVGASRLYLLDTDIPANAEADRWITARLYIGNRQLRLAQYAILGIGGMRAVEAMGIRPRLVHLNEGHSVMAALESIRRTIESGQDASQAIQAVRSHFVFTTHTPVMAGNESFNRDELNAALPDLEESLHLDEGTLWRLADGGEGHPFGLTPLALRLSRSANGVSELHGHVARAMWSHLQEAVPISHVTNGVHLPTWMAPEWQAILDRYITGWRDGPPGSAVWQAIESIPDEEIWEVRCELRRQLASVVRRRSVRERLGRGELVAYAESAADAWSDDTLTIGFARRIATYKRLYLLTARPERAVAVLRGQPSVQLVIAGRAHPQDEAAKGTVQFLFGLNDVPGVGGRAVFLEEYDLALARHLVRGCDLWLNLPRRPQEACGTSGMKSAANGGIQLSVLDGWWAEAQTPAVGWGIPSDPALSAEEQDCRDSDRCYEILEREAIPMFYDRDEQGIPRRWVAMIRATLRDLVPRFSAARMAHEYGASVYSEDR